MVSKLNMKAAIEKVSARTPGQGAEPTATQPAGRQGKTNIAGYFPPAVKTQLRILGAEQSRTIQRLLAEALNDLFAKYSKPEIVPLDE